MSNPADSKSAQPRRRISVAALGLGVIFIALAVLALFHIATRLDWIDEPLAFGTEPTVIIVERGMIAEQIGRRLVDAGVLPSVARWRQLLSVTGGATELRAGSYTVAPTMTPRQLVALLQSRTEGGIRVTLVEGWTTAQMAEALAEAGLCDEASFHRAVAAHPRHAALPADRSDLEGYLFPDTHFFVPGMAPEAIVEALVAGFETAVNLDAHRASAEAVGLTLDEAVTLASIIEREARIADERVEIAGIFHNRLRRGMRLESCATVHFAIGDWSRPLRTEDTETEHPYNTYEIIGLPPGPICNPGLASLRAAIAPAETDNLFFVFDETLGRHRFSRTFAEHQRAVRAAR